MTRYILPLLLSILVVNFGFAKVRETRDPFTGSSFVESAQDKVRADFQDKKMKGSATISFQEEITPAGETNFSLIIKTQISTKNDEGLGEGKEILGLNGFKKPLVKISENSRTDATSIHWGFGISTGSKEMKFEEIYKVSFTFAEIQDLLEAMKINKGTALKLVSVIGREMVISLKKTKSIEEFVMYIQSKGSF